MRLHLLAGFNFGDAHLHNEGLTSAVQRQAAFEPGESGIAWADSEAFSSGDAVNDQPWLANGWSLHSIQPAVVRDDPEHGHGALA